MLFLEFNGVILSDPEGALYKAMMALASGRLGKRDLIDVFR